ncbi:MAG: DUF4012 domain-containing protein [Parcubacteria group bacterium]
MDIIKKNKKSKLGDYKKYHLGAEKLKILKEDGIKCQICRFGQVFNVDEDVFLLESKTIKEISNNSEHFKEDINDSLFVPSEDIYNDFVQDLTGVNDENKFNIDYSSFFRKNIFLNWIVLVPIVFCVFIFGGLYVKKGFDTKKQVLGVSEKAYGNIGAAIEGIKKQDFSMSADKFSEAYKNFSEISNSLQGLGSGAISFSRFIPGASKLSSGYHLTEAGKELSLAGEEISRVAKTMSDLKEDFSRENEDKELSLLEIFLSFQKNLDEIRGHLIKAQNNLNEVKITDIPKKNQQDLLALKNQLPVIMQATENFSANSNVVADFLGANGPRKYLFLLQNNQEMRATGGFIGSYGVLDIDSNGKIRNFFIDGIFNPDGQLMDKIVPPKPIQKISTAWSLHDSNWFPDFPVSAKKAMLFYEKTGGPTVDGVITLTPTVMQKLLAITGPIEMKDFGVVLTKDNFIESVQYEVEEDYDKEENRPKKILSDLAPILLDKLFNSKDAKTLAQTVNVFSEALQEKHILFYFSNNDLQKVISDLGWSGEILRTPNDYLSVINTNINGYKTDGVVEEKIDQQVDIGINGEIVNTVIITRKHNGGNTQYDWWNKVNDDYMRVYVPEGSTLLQVEGQTREINEDVIDYKSLGFKEDADVKREESQMKIDDETGTRVYNESGKTVFANWVYVSPQEEVSVKYKYLLPFKIGDNKEVGSYSLLNQKQAGSLGDKFNFSISYPSSWKDEWKSEELKECSLNKDNYLSICLENDLKTDKFLGVVFSKN